MGNRGQTFLADAIAWHGMFETTSILRGGFHENLIGRKLLDSDRRQIPDPDSCFPSFALNFGPSLRGGWKIDQFDRAGLILVYAKHEEAFFGNAGLRRWTEFDR